MSRKCIIIDGIIETIKYNDVFLNLIEDLTRIKNDDNEMDIEPLIFHKYYKERTIERTFKYGGTFFELPICISTYGNRMDMIFVNIIEAHGAYTKSITLDKNIYGLYEKEYAQYKRNKKLERICND